ncbi:LOW QUALITY PROTEIN: IQ domain-containing protein C [Myiozetetes cayanensis]|uniref:LOW QUALITY PROTEIN: IQ domain-containing protein C n=1 Tax=Myiozetetes cayanensis TaxID=478635 RepID=UPI00215F9937|nr:LOW QUALITY PROTEIN: IQ domain-containing protein C [Myiozetetes cayanensis]
MAALGPRAEAEGRRRLLRALTRLQACARGFLLRQRLRRAREDFEAAVLEIDGDLRALRWTGQLLLRPSFDPDPQGPAQPLDPQEGSTKNPPEEPEPPEPDETPQPPCRAGQPPPPRARDTLSPPNVGVEGDKGTEKESEEWDKESSETSVWDSCDLGTEPLGAHPEIPLGELPRSRSGLQAYRSHLLMELLWLQQAIASRKNFLMLKRKLGIPDPLEGVPKHLDWCGGALEELQHQG